MSEKLTKKQERVFSFLVSYEEENGYAPTLREISEQLGFSAANSAKKYLDILERKKYINRSGGKPRAIEILKNTPEKNIKMVPVLGRIAAGAPILALENIEDTIAVDASMAKWEDVFLLRVQGESMIDAHIQDNDLVMIKPQPDAESGEIVAALINDEATVKRLIKDDAHIKLKPENPSMKPIVIKDGNVKIIGKVVGVIRKY